MDDDVQYLGTRLAAPEPLDDPCEARRSLTGIVLHVEKCGEKPAHDLTFYRARSGFVNIGRKSGSDDRSMRRENDDHNAVFACQVVSARHAKLVLSDSGHVYILDLHSRHGTHLLRRGETTSRMLQAEVETLLADGDVLTFGKVVGAGSYHVSPVTARVELLRGHSASEPSVDLVLTPSNPPTPVLSRLRKLSSGRYGLISASCMESDSPHSPSSISVSSDGASSPSEQESDVEDQESCILATILRDSQGKPSVKIPAFRSFIREMYHSPASHSPAASDDPDVLPGDVPNSPISLGAIRLPCPGVVIEPFLESRSPSPMVTNTSPEELQPEPAVIGAWPVSRPDSPRHSPLEVETGRSGVLPAPEPVREAEPIPAQTSTSPGGITPVSNDTLIEVIHRLPPPPPFFPVGGPFSSSIASDFGLPSVPPPPPPPHRMPPFHPLHKVVTECVTSEVKASFKSVEDRITTLQETINDLKLRQAVTEEDVVDLQSRCETLEPESERLLCRISGAERNIASLSTLQGQMTTLQNLVTKLREKFDAAEPRHAETPMENVLACANALNNLVSEMKSLREDVEKRIEAKMMTVKSAHAEALDTLKGVIIEAKSVRSSKRKRDNMETDEDTPMVVGPAACVPPLVVNETPVEAVPVPKLPVPDLPVIEVSPTEVLTPEPIRPKKRARSAMHTVVHTAAAMAIGAAATWSALAFF